MLPIVSQLNFILALGTIGLQIAAIALFAAFIWERIKRRRSALGMLAERFAMPLAFLLSASGIVLTLVYSEVFGFTPCGLCWFQRIFLYPQAVIAGLALVVRDRVMAPIYLIALSVFGAIVALYQHYLQMGGSDLIACPASTESCAQRILFEFNYITFPLMAFSIFAFLAALFLLARFSRAAPAPLERA